MEPKTISIARLGTWDLISLVLGIIIGVGIFKTPSSVFQGAPFPEAAIGLWILAGGLALIGALCFAELACAFPRSGGEYVYLTHGFGSLVGFLFAWAQLTVIRPGSICAVAYIFAQNIFVLFPSLAWMGTLPLAGVAVLALSLINVLGVSLGAATQNILTGLKIAGLAALVLAGFLWGTGDVRLAMPVVEPEQASGAKWFFNAMVPILWTYGGWNEAAYVASEVRDPKRDIPRSLIGGVAIVTFIYVLVNLAFLRGLGAEGAKSDTAATDLMELIAPTWGPKAMAILISLSALGGLNGMIFTTARIYSEFGADHRLFAPISRWSRRWGTPARALIVQAVFCLLVFALMVATSDKSDPFEQILDFTAAAYWVFFLLTGLSVLVLRKTEPKRERPFRVPFDPWLTLLFCGLCCFMVISAIRYKPDESLASLSILAVGLPFYYIPRRKKREPKRELEPVGQP